QMERIGDHRDGFHDAIFATVCLLVQNLVRTGRLTPNMSWEMIEQLLTPFLAEIEDTTRKAPLGHRSAHDVERDLSRLHEMVQWVLDREFSRGAFRLGDAHYCSTAVSLEAANELQQRLIEQH